MSSKCIQALRAGTAQQVAMPKCIVSNTTVLQYGRDQQHANLHIIFWSAHGECRPCKVMLHRPVLRPTKAIIRHHCMESTFDEVLLSSVNPQSKSRHSIITHFDFCGCNPVLERWYATHAVFVHYDIKRDCTLLQM